MISNLAVVVPETVMDVYIILCISQLSFFESFSFL